MKDGKEEAFLILRKNTNTEESTERVSIYIPHTPILKKNLHFAHTMYLHVPCDSQYNDYFLKQH